MQNLSILLGLLVAVALALATVAVGERATIVVAAPVVGGRLCECVSVVRGLELRGIWGVEGEPQLANQRCQGS